MTKVLIIKAKDEFELVKKFNEDKREFFATQPIQKNDGSWILFCYYKDIEESKEEFIPATKSQLDYIYKNELDVNTENLTKKEAWKLIKEHKK
jgi:hypothetical protein